MPIQSANPPQLHTFQNWTLGLNQQTGRGSIADDEQWWNENLFAIGPGNLRSCWGPGPVLYTAPAGVTILRIFFGFIGDITPQNSAPPPGRYGWMFLSDGSIDQVDVDTLAVTHIGTAAAPVWQPIAPQYWASAKVWRPRFVGNVSGQQGGVLFGSPLGMFGWDGTTLSRPGDPAPDWLTDALEVSPGVPFTMPTGLPGIYTMEVYQSRLFVAGKDVISFSAPSNGADFSTTDGGGSFGYFGDRLTYSYMDLAATAGYLYVFGDSSVDLINQVELIGSGTPEAPFTTNLAYTNVDPQVGQRFPRPVGRIGRFMQTWNGAGIFELRGGEAIEIGQKTTNVFNTLVIPKTASDTTLYYPTMAPATMFGFRVLLCNGRFTDIYGVTRNLILMWHPRTGSDFWSIASQGAGLELTNIASYEQDSVITPFGTDGTHLYQLFATPDPNLLKILSTKFVRGEGLQQLTIKNAKRIFMEFFDNDGRGVNWAGNLTTTGGGIPNGIQEVNFALAPGPHTPAQIAGPAGTASTSAFEPQALQGAGIAAALDIQSLSPDFTLERIHLMVEDRTLWGA
jgi:hypothetical protein